MTDWRELYASAVLDHREGRLAAAKSKYQVVLERCPTHADSLHMLGVIASGHGEKQAAFGYFGKAVALVPTNANFLNNLGVSARSIGQTDTAIEAFLVALKVSPGQLDTLINLGNALLDSGDATGALERYEQALTRDAANAAALGGAAAACRRLGDLDRAQSIYEGLVAANGNDAVARNNLGVVKMERGESEAAIIDYHNALEIDPNLFDSLNNIAVALLDLGNAGAAETFLRRALVQEPQSAAVQGNLGNALRRQSFYEEAAESYRAALAIDPTPGLKMRLASLLPIIPSSGEQMRTARQSMETAVDALLGEMLRIDDPMGEVGMTQFQLSYHDTNNRTLNRKIAGFYQKACPSLSYTAPHCQLPKRESGDRLKVGFISQYFRDHAVGWCYQGVMRNMPRDRISVSAFTFGNGKDALWRAIAKDVDEAVLLPKSLAAAREKIAAAELDVLVYTDIGMDPLTYFLAFARLAPVQCVTNGHPDTTGIPTIDYFVSSAPLENPDSSGAYSETLAALENVLVHYERPQTPDTDTARSAYGLPQDKTLYVCPQSLFKIHPDMDTAFGRILEEDPQGQLIVFAGPEPSWSELLLQRWRKSIGKNIDRIQVLERQSFDDFLNILGFANVILDTWPFCGGNTTYQGLAMGTPIVTFPGRFARGRSTMALYEQLEITEVIANSPANYAEIAVHLGTDPAWRSEVSTKITERSERLFGDHAAVDAFADFLLSVGHTRGVET